MAALEILKRIWAGLSGLGVRRLAALGLTGLTVFILVGVSGYVLNRPQQEAIYTGLEASDVSRMGAVLSDSGISFDISATGDSVLVEYGKAAKARMILAEKGLPRGDSAGYELFDKLGSLGLTTFMQQVTKVRALEGELARTIQLIDGIKAARVHLALKSEGSFRGNTDQPTASVVIRTEGDGGKQAANAIRHLVAAAIPGLSVLQVTVMSADGTLLTSTDDPANAAPEKLIGLERSLSADIEARIARTMAPIVGADNIRVSVAAKLNADRRQTTETAFDPNSRVERSVRTIKESGEASNAAGAAGVTVEQNVPVEETPKANGDSSNERKDRKEELTNYEINSKSTSTVSEGYEISRLSVAVVINRPSLLKMLGENPSEDAIKAKIVELQELATSSAGLVEDRGDKIRVSAAEFVEMGLDLSDPASPALGSFIEDNLGSMIRAGSLVIVTLLILLLGLRPALRVIMDDKKIVAEGAIPSLTDGTGSRSVVSETGSERTIQQVQMPGLSDHTSDPVFDGLVRDVSNSPRDRLAKIVELDPDRAVDVLKQWLSEPAGRES